MGNGHKGVFSIPTVLLGPALFITATLRNITEILIEVFVATL